MPVLSTAESEEEVNWIEVLLLATVTLKSLICTVAPLLIASLLAVQFEVAPIDASNSLAVPLVSFEVL